MARTVLPRESARRLAAVTVVVFTLVAVAFGVVSAAGSTDVGLSPETRSLDVGENATVEIVVENASGGVGSYDMRVTVDDPAVAEITDASVSGSPMFDNQSITSDGRRVDVTASGADTANTGAVTVATVRFEATGPGSTDLTLSVTDVGDEEGVSYAVRDVRGATVSVSRTPTPTPTPTAEPTDDPDTDNDRTDSFAYDVTVEDDMTALELTDASANRRYDTDLGESIAAGGSTVTAVELFFERTVSEGLVRFEATETPPDEVTELDGAIAYVSADSDDVDDDQIAEVELEFTVARSTLDDREVSPENVQLYRFDGGAWVAHETTHEGGDRFIAENVPRFGVFAIGPAGAAAVTESPTPTPTPTAEPTAATSTTTAVVTTEPAETTSVETPTATPVVTSQSQTETTSTTFPGFGPTVVLLALVVATVIATRVSRRR